MRVKRIGLLGIALIALICITATPVLAWPAGHSPGYWKHQFWANYYGKGKAHVSTTELMEDIGLINAHYGDADQIYYDGYTLPWVSDLDYDGDLDFDYLDVLSIFGDTSWNYMWTPMANWFNYVNGLGPWW